MIRHALAERERNQLSRARLLPAQVEMAIALADLETDRAAAEEMEAIADTYRSAVLRATALCCPGALQLAQGDSRSALRNLRQGLHLWQEIAAPYDAARARICAAAAYRADGDEESARLELESARSTFERLGASRDAARASELLRAGVVLQDM